MKGPWVLCTILRGLCIRRGDLLRMLVEAMVTYARMEMWVHG